MDIFFFLKRTVQSPLLMLYYDGGDRKFVLLLFLVHEWNTSERDIPGIFPYTSYGQYFAHEELCEMGIDEEIRALEIFLSGIIKKELGSLDDNSSEHSRSPVDRIRNLSNSIKKKLANDEKNRKLRMEFYIFACIGLIYLRLLVLLN
ncbi:hypothetical protein NPIL_695371 [Nephila pilipes]|uniref:Uncharacterized protein n=1 Tax=Nephila pilipes TaxID=299642 RepID=A0A8X6U0M0_NEPPI|nr:hypothetical protein NPIL_695371 [Nephila pilipes]